MTCRFGDALRRHRQAAGLSLAELSVRVNYSKSYLSKVETGRARGTRELAVLCDSALGASGELAENPLGLDEGGGPDAETGVRARPMPEHGLDLLLALDAAHNSLRHVAGGDADAPQRAIDAVRAVQDSGLYTMREQLLVSGSVALVQAAESAFRRLVDIRNVVRAGADLESADYHRAYHAFAAALWSYRMALRAELGRPELTPPTLDLQDWSDRDRCATCKSRRS